MLLSEGVAVLGVSRGASQLGNGLNYDNYNIDQKSGTVNMSECHALHVHNLLESLRSVQNSTSKVNQASIAVREGVLPELSVGVFIVATASKRLAATANNRIRMEFFIS